MADEGIGGLAYSGKIMAPTAFTPLVASVRDKLETISGIRFDCCLVNFYPDGDSACAWHSDPDHGRLWSLDECVVSIGETRRFNLRLLPHAAPEGEREQHSFHLRDGDVFWMTRDCNDKWEHTVLKAEGPDNAGPRMSFVFKQARPPSSLHRGASLVRNRLLLAPFIRPTPRALR
ncbi:hypothetical protein T484DRAFT_1615659 [Baffinella frigidus]|nr:hypothetical protein T484DRAFT_1615659 [Cryptophyta sp. CCMP2293]